MRIGIGLDISSVTAPIGGTNNPPSGQQFVTVTDIDGVEQFETVTDINGDEQRITIAVGTS